MRYSLFIQHFGLFIIALLASIAFTLFVYRKTVPAVPFFSKAILSVIRAVTFFLILMILFQGQLYYLVKHNLAPTIGIAIDNSASMSVKDSYGERKEIVGKALNDRVLDQLQEKFKLEYYTFSGQVTPLKKDQLDELEYSGDITNITKVLSEIQKDQQSQNLSAIILYSDGNYNLGGNPARFITESNIPIYPVAIGSPNPIQDISIDYVESNPYTYVDNPTDFNITIRGAGYNQLNFPLSMFVDDKPIATETISLPASPSEIEIQMQYTPQTEGQHKVSFSIPLQINELVSQNNKVTVYHDVLKAKQNVSIIAGVPGPDISFLSRYLSNTDRYLVTKLVQKKDGSFYDTDKDFSNIINETDIFIFLNYPIKTSNSAVLSQLHDYINEQKTPLWYIYGPQTDFSKLARFENFLPFKTIVKPINKIQISPVLTVNGQTHPVLLGNMENGDIRYNWQKLPPAYTSMIANNIWPGTQVLANAVTGNPSQQPIPLILVRNINEHKSSALLANETWRWDLMMRGVDNNDIVYGNYVLNTIQWLEVKKETDWIQISTDKDNYNFGDPIHITTRIINKDVISNYKNEIILQLEHNNEIEYLQPIEKDESSFTKTIYLQSPGDYRISLETPALPKDKYTTTLFSIGDYSAELSNTRTQVPVLMELAAKSGGKYIVPDSLGQLLTEISGQQLEIANSYQVDIWNHKYILFLIIFFLALEWFLRKKFGML